MEPSTKFCPDRALFKATSNAGHHAQFKLSRSSATLPLSTRPPYTTLENTLVPQIPLR